MQCPICETVIVGGASNCPQCSSDLEVFQMLDTLSSPRKAERSAILSRTTLTWIGGMLSFAMLILLALSARLNFVMIDELRGERSLRAESAERQLKLTKEVVENLSGSFVATISSITQTEVDRLANLQVLNSRVDELMQRQARVEESQRVLQKGKRNVQSLKR